MELTASQEDQTVRHAETIEAPSVPTVVRTAGEVLSNGIVIELVARAGAPQLGLLIWDGTRAEFVDSFTDGGVRYLPIELDASAVRAIRFPNAVANYESERQLIQELSGLVSAVTRISDDDAERIALYVASTQFTDSLPMAPLLWATAPPGVAREPLLHVLGFLCRRAVRVGELTLDVLRSLPMELRPAIVAEELRLSRSLMRAIRMSSKRGVYAPVRGELHDLCCSKAVCANQPFDDSELSDAVLTVSLAPVRNGAPTMDTTEIERHAEALRAKLLQLRLRNCHSAAGWSPNLSELTPSAHNLARATP